MIRLPRVWRSVLVMAIAAAVLLAEAGGAATIRPAATMRLSANTLPQGRTAWVTVTSGEALSQAPLVRFAGRAWPMYAAGAEWRTLIAVDATTKPGRYAVSLVVTYAGGRQFTTARTVSVTKVAFPKRRLTFSPDRQALLTPEQAAYERRRVTAALSVLHPTQLWEGVFIRPVDAKVSSPYGVLSIYQGSCADSTVARISPPRRVRRFARLRLESFAWPRSCR